MFLNNKQYVSYNSTVQNSRYITTNSHPSLYLTHLCPISWCQLLDLLAVAAAILAVLPAFREWLRAAPALASAVAI
jgi:hypothetical protein